MPHIREPGRAGERLDQDRSHDRRGLRLRPARPDQPLKLFSGGNQQKVVLANWLRVMPRVLQLDEPTQGGDVGAKAAIYELIFAARRQGAAVLLCSSDTKELVTLCDRVLVLSEGRIFSEVARAELTEERLVSDELGHVSAGADR